MKTLLAFSALTLSSLIYALPASAGCADQGASGALARMSSGTQSFAPALRISSTSSSASSSIVGTWFVAYTSGGQPAGQAFIQWHSDGTEWENVNFPVLGGNLCLGSWKAIDATHVSRNHYGWLYNAGLLFGYFNEKETDELSKDGNSYTGTNQTWLYDLSGNQMGYSVGLAAAKRIAP